MLTKKDKELADKVQAAYKGVDDGKLYKWAGKTALQDRMKYPKWSTGYIESIHATILAVICKMIVEGVIELN